MFLKFGMALFLTHDDQFSERYLELHYSSIKRCSFFSNLQAQECNIIENRKAYIEILLVTLQDFLHDRHESAFGALIL